MHIMFTGKNPTEIEAGRKTQTRRIIEATGAQKTWLTAATMQKVQRMVVEHPESHPASWSILSAGHIGTIVCPYGSAGDRLWVREGWGISLAQSGAGWADGGATLTYRDGGKQVALTKERFNLPDTVGQLKNFRAAWRSPRFMPRWASRLTLELVEVRAERLNDISEIDAKAEGISEVPFYPDDGFPLSLGYMVGPDDKKGILETSARGAYRIGWESIHGPGSWSRNPWVWALTFRSVQ